MSSSWRLLPPLGLALAFASPAAASDVRLFVGMQGLGGVGWATTDFGWKQLDTGAQPAFVASLRGGVIIGRHQVALEVAPFSDIPTHVGPYTALSGALFRVAGSYGYFIPVFATDTVTLYWPVRLGVGVLTGGNNSWDAAFFEARGDLVGLAVRAGHVLVELDTPSFRCAYSTWTYSTSAARSVRLFTWHFGGAVSYVF